MCHQSNLVGLDLRKLFGTALRSLVPVLAENAGQRQTLRTIQNAGTKPEDIAHHAEFGMGARMLPTLTPLLVPVFVVAASAPLNIRRAKSRNKQ